MKAKYITIEREYGSGGTAIARRLSEETGIPSYGVEILQAVADRHNVSVDLIEQYEESSHASLLYGLYAMTQAAGGKTDFLSTEGHLFLEEQKQILQKAREGKCVFLGHCASEALKDTEGVVRVFIRNSDEQEKNSRIRDEYQIPENQVEKTRKYYDRKRSNYYNANTKRQWDDMKNYDLVLDSAVLGEDTCVRVLKELLA